MVRTKRDTRGGSFNRRSATRREVGKVAFDEAVEKAMTLASWVSRKKAIGFFLPSVARSSGKTTNIWIASARSTTPT